MSPTDTLTAIAGSGPLEATTGNADGILRVGEIELDQSAHIVVRGIREIHLDPVEFRLLTYMMEHPGRLLARADLMAAAWADGRAVDTTTLTTYICRLRRALNRGREKDPIRTVRGLGYVFGSRREV